MYNARSSYKIGSLVSKTRIPNFRVIVNRVVVNLVLILATVLNMKIVRTKSSFLDISDSF